MFIKLHMTINRVRSGIDSVNMTAWELGMNQIDRLEETFEDCIDFALTWEKAAEDLHNKHQQFKYLAIEKMSCWLTEALQVLQLITGIQENLYTSYKEYNVLSHLEDSDCKSEE